MTLGFDISTSCIGIALFDNKDNNYKLLDLSYINLDKKKTYFKRYDEFVDFFENDKKYNKLPIQHISIEEPLKRFMGKFSSADTLHKLASMNAMISLYLYKTFNIEPHYFNVSHARKVVFPNLIIPQGHPNKKYLVWDAVMRVESQINWIYSERTHKLIDENFDMCDAYVAGMCSIINMAAAEQSEVK